MIFTNQDDSWGMLVKTNSCNLDLQDMFGKFRPDFFLGRSVFLLVELKLSSNLYTQFRKEDPRYGIREGDPWMDDLCPNCRKKTPAGGETANTFQNFTSMFGEMIRFDERAYFSDGWGKPSTRKTCSKSSGGFEERDIC